MLLFLLTVFYLCLVLVRPQEYPAMVGIGVPILSLTLMAAFGVWLMSRNKRVDAPQYLLLLVFLLDLSGYIVVLYGNAHWAPGTEGIEERTVKANIHPVYHKVMVKCACGNEFETRSTSASVHVEVCAKCHPYFTGKQRMLDTQGRVDRFRKKYSGDKAASGAQS